MKLKFRKRKGFSLLDVALAAVVLIVGTMGMGQFFNSIYAQLTPTGSWGGLRRYLLAEEMLRAQAEGLRVMQTIPASEASCKLITEPPGLGYNLTVDRTAGPTSATAEEYYYDISIAQGPTTSQQQTIGAISMSTVRAIGTLGGTDGKIGL